MTASLEMCVHVLQRRDEDVAEADDLLYALVTFPYPADSVDQRFRDADASEA